MAMAARLGPALAHAQSSRLVALQGSRAGKGGLELAPNERQARPVRSRRVRAVNGSTIRAAKKAAPPIMPAVLTPSGPVDLSTLMLRNRIIFVGSPVNSEVVQSVISKLLTLAAINDEEEIKIKPDVSTVCFGIAASQGALVLAGGKKGKRFAMPNARIMIHQPQGGCGGTADDVRRQVDEVMSFRDEREGFDSVYRRTISTIPSVGEGEESCGVRVSSPARPVDTANVLCILSASLLFSTFFCFFRLGMRALCSPVRSVRVLLSAPLCYSEHLFICPEFIACGLNVLFYLRSDVIASLHST